MSQPLKPVHEEIKYLAHQEEGIRWMMDREAVGAPVCRGGILADDMGLGKTFQIIGLLKNGQALRTLIVCPPALISGWKDECIACGYSVSVLQNGKWVSVGPKDGVAIFLTSYSKIGLYSTRLANGDVFERVVLDEGHIIRNGKSTSRWTSCMTVSKMASCRWILSATPVQNGTSDWKNLCAWLRTVVPAKPDVDAAVVVTPSSVPSIIMKRRTRSELRGTIEELPLAPHFIEHALTISKDTPEGELFRVLCNHLETALERSAPLAKLEQWMRIQQFLVHPQIYISSMRASLLRKGIKYPRPDWTHGSTKWTACMSDLASAVSEKVPTIVFCNFRSEMDMVQAEAERLGGSVFTVRGGMGSEKVGIAVAEAKAAAGREEPVVVVVQIVAGGAGINLQFCRRILFLSMHWNPAVVHQAIGRAVRIGQRHIVDIHVYRVTDDVMDNLDSRMVSAHTGKIAAAKEVCSSLFSGYLPLPEVILKTIAPAEEGDPTNLV